MHMRFQPAGAALLAALCLACGRREHPLKIGALVPLTGAEASFGHSTRQGYELAVAEQNARGGVLGRRIRLVLADDQGDPAEGAAGCTRLIATDRVAAILGPAMSSVALASAPIAQSEQVPMVTPTASHPKVTEMGDYIFRICFTDAFQGALGANFAWDDLLARRAACLCDGGNDYSRGLADCFKTTFAARGGQVSMESHAPGAREFRSQVARLLAAKPDVLYLPGFVHEVALIAREARRQGYHGPLLGGDGWESARLAELGGDAVEQGFYTTHCARDDPHPRVQAHVRNFQARYQAPPDALSILAYDAACVLMDAIARAGAADGPAVQQALMRTEFQGVSGPIRFDAHRNPRKSATIMQIQKGRPIYRATLAPPQITP